MDAKKLLAPKYAAQEIVEAAHTAYWLASYGTGHHEFQVQEIHRNFAKLADVLGYRIEKIETEERTCQITGFKYEGGIAKPFTDEQLGVA